MLYEKFGLNWVGGTEEVKYVKKKIKKNVYRQADEHHTKCDQNRLVTQYSKTYLQKLKK